MKKCHFESRSRQLSFELENASRKNSELITYCETKINSCRKEYQKLLRNVDQLKRDNLSLRHKIEHTEKFERNQTDYQKECFRLRSTVTALKSETRNLKEQLDEKNKKCFELQSNIILYKHQLTGKNRNILKVSKEVEHLKKQLSDQSQSNTSTASYTFAYQSSTSLQRTLAELLEEQGVANHDPLSYVSLINDRMRVFSECCVFVISPCN